MFYQFQHFGASEAFSREHGYDFSFPLHLHQSFEFITTLSGEIEVIVDQKHYHLRRGDCVLIFPNQLHALNCPQSEHMLCIFSPELVKAYASKKNAMIPDSNQFQLDPRLIDELSALSENAPSFEKKAILYPLCAQFDKNAVFHPREKSEYELLFEIFHFVEENYRSDCSLDALSKAIGFHYSYLSRYFKKMTDISYNEYVNRRRISNVCYLLTNTPNSMIECAFESGYASLRSFNRNFKSIVGMTPLEYRNRS